MRFLLLPQLHEISDDFQPDASAPLLELLTAEEYENGDALPEILQLPAVKPSTIGYCQTEVLPNGILGTLRIPDKSEPLKHTLSFSYALQNSYLLLIDEKKHLPALLQLLEKLRPCRLPSAAALFAQLLKLCIQDDGAYLQALEQRLATMENSMLESLPKELLADILGKRRELLIFRSYYLQLQELCEIFSHASPLISEEVCRQFTFLAGRTARLCDQTQLLREYALQIQQLHQTQLDIRQNDTMRILTVVTTLFLPLSLIAGWYGMNFVHMPEIRHPLGYVLISLLSLIILCTEIWFFKKKGWI